MGMFSSCVKLNGVSYITCQLEGQYLLQSPAAVILDRLSRHNVSYFLKFRHWITAFEVIYFTDCFPTLFLINKFDN